MSTNTGYHVESIGKVTSSRTHIQDDEWGDIHATITLNKEVFTSDALKGLESFSHLHIIYLFDQIEPGWTESRHPRNNQSWPEVGIFAQRAKRRPNRLGLTCCELVEVRHADLILVVKALDAIHGTPILDIKPFMVEFDLKHHTTQPEWSSELMRGYF